MAFESGKKIVHIVSGLRDGGAERTLFNLCSNDRGNIHFVISLTDFGVYGARLRAFGIPVVALGFQRRRVSLRGLQVLSRCLRHERPDIVQTWMYHGDLIGGLVARLSGISPVVWNIRHTELIPGKSSKSTIWIARACAKLSRYVPERIVCCANASAKEHARLGYDASRMVVISNGFDTLGGLSGAFEGQRYVARTRILETLGINRAPFIFTHVARFDPQKDHIGLIAAMALLREATGDFVCLMVGSGIDSSNKLLTNAIRKAGLEHKIVLLGRRDDVRDLFLGADANVLSSSFGEGFPNVVAEAMAVGTPCIVTRTGDADVIVGKYGWVVPPDSPTEMAGALLKATKLRKDTGDWKKLQCGAIGHIRERYSLSAMISNYNALWSEIGSLKA